MDRKTWIAVGLSIVGLIVWQQTFVKQANERRLAAQQAAAQAALSAPTPSGTPLATATPQPGSTPSATSTPLVERKTESLLTADSEYVFQSDTGGIEEVRLLQHLGEVEGNVILNADKDLPIGAFGTSPGQVIGGFEMSVDKAASAVVFQKTDTDGLVIEKRFIVTASEDKAQKYSLKLEVRFRNTAAIELTRPGYFLSTGGAGPIHTTDLPTYTRFDWYRDGKMHGIDVNWFPAGKIPLIGIQTSPEKSIYNETNDQIAWAAVTSQYFCTILTAENPLGSSVWAKRFDMHRAGRAGEAYGIQGGLGLPAFSLIPGQERVETFQIYAGPKEYAVLTELKTGQKAVMNFGFFGLVSEVLLWAMHLLHNVFNSYGIAIIVLTLIIKTLLWPMQNMATNSMRRMAALAPKMTEMREKYKDDPQKLNQETMKLYRDYGVNPFAGCLPMLIQIPIFFGFYTMLGASVELRDSAFLWIPDLSQPDTVWHIPGINFPINLLPLIMSVTMIWQMAITPKTGDAVQQRIFYFMPVIFLIFCYNYASGLALYWTTQNIFSIVQLYMTRNKPLPTLEKKSVIAKREQALTKKKKKKP